MDDKSPHYTTKGTLICAAFCERFRLLIKPHRRSDVIWPLDVNNNKRGRSNWGWAFCVASISCRPGSCVNKKLIRGLSSSCQVSGTTVWDIVGHTRLVLPWITTSCGSHAEIPLQSEEQLGGNASDFGATMQIALTTNLLSLNSVRGLVLSDINRMALCCSAMCGKGPNSQHMQSDSFGVISEGDELMCGGVHVGSHRSKWWRCIFLLHTVKWNGLGMDVKLVFALCDVKLWQHTKVGKKSILPPEDTQWLPCLCPFPNVGETERSDCRRKLNQNIIVEAVNRGLTFFF